MYVKVALHLWIVLPTILGTGNRMVAFVIMERKKFTVVREMVGRLAIQLGCDVTIAVMNGRRNFHNEQGKVPMTMYSFRDPRQTPEITLEYKPSWAIVEYTKDPLKGQWRIVATFDDHSNAEWVCRKYRREMVNDVFLAQINT